MTIDSGPQTVGDLTLARDGRHRVRLHAHGVDVRVARSRLRALADLHRTGRATKPLRDARSGHTVALTRVPGGGVDVHLDDGRSAAVVILEEPDAARLVAAVG